MSYKNYNFEELENRFFKNEIESEPEIYHYEYNDTEEDVRRKNIRKSISKKQQEIYKITNQLASSNSNIGDWKIIKCYEAKLNERELPYDLNELMTMRDQARAKINQLQDEIKILEKEL